MRVEWVAETKVGRKEEGTRERKEWTKHASNRERGRKKNRKRQTRFINPVSTQAYYYAKNGAQCTRKVYVF
jgi:hypothetical protein